MTDQMRSLLQAALLGLTLAVPASDPMAANPRTLTDDEIVAECDALAMVQEPALNANTLAKARVWIEWQPDGVTVDKVFRHGSYYCGLFARETKVIEVRRF